MNLADENVLFKAMQFCLKQKSKCGNECYSKCPLQNQLCISSKGDLILGERDKDDHINFVKFTEQFRKMIEVISED